MQLNINCGEHVINTFCTAEGSFISRHTGKPLKSLEVVFKTDEHIEWAREFANSGAVVKTDEPEGKQWRIGKNDSMETVGSPDVEFTWELLEAESLQPTALILDGWALKPYKYAEEFIGSVLQITARIEVTAEEKDRFRDMPECFQVVREGVDERSRMMRFGQCLWARSGENFRIGFWLFDKELYDKERTHGFNEPRQSNTVARIIRTSMELRGLLGLLVEKGVLSQADVEKVQNLDRKEVSLETWTQDYVADLDEWLDKEGD
jgi:hypothetical protein